MDVRASKALKVIICSQKKSRTNLQNVGKVFKFKLDVVFSAKKTSGRQTEVRHDLHLLGFVAKDLKKNQMVVRSHNQFDSKNQIFKANPTSQLTLMSFVVKLVGTHAGATKKVLT